MFYVLFFLRNIPVKFDVLLTVHLSIFISVFNQLDAQNLFHNKFLFHTYSWPSRARDGQL